MLTEQETKKASWKDFSLEEHIRAFVSCPVNSEIKIIPITSHMHRVNTWTDGKINSWMLKIIETPDGYIIEDMTKRSA